MTIVVLQAVSAMSCSLLVRGGAARPNGENKHVLNQMEFSEL